MGRSPCCSKDSTLTRGAWTVAEDMILSQYITTHGEGGWRALSQKAGLMRCGKSCRLRWLNYLRPDIKRGNISPDEEELIIRLHRLLGNRWSLIAGRLPGRTDNEVKNYWNSKLSKRLPHNETLPQSKNLQAKLKPAPGEGDAVLKITPVKATAVRIPKCRNDYDHCSGGYNSHHQDLRSADAAQDAETSKFWSELLVDDFIVQSNSDFIDSPITQNFVKSGFPTIGIDNYSPSSLYNCIDRNRPSALDSAENEVNICQNLLHLNGLPSPNSKLLSSRYDSTEDFEPRSTSELEQIFSVEFFSW